MKLIKNLAVFGTGVVTGAIGMCMVFGFGLYEGDKVYEDDDICVRSISKNTDGYQMAMIYDKNVYEGNIDW